MIELDFALSWIEEQEQTWWETNPTGTDEEFEEEFYEE